MGTVPPIIPGYDMLRPVIWFSHWHVYSDNCSCATFSCIQVNKEALLCDRNERGKQHSHDTHYCRTFSVSANDIVSRGSTWQEKPLYIWLLGQNQTLFPPSSSRSSQVHFRFIIHLLFIRSVSLPQCHWAGKDAWFHILLTTAMVFGRGQQRWLVGYGASTPIYCAAT